MSNRRKSQPPRVVLHAQRWRCPDCSSDSGRPWRDPGRVWHLPFMHDDSCPGLRGVVALPVAFLGFNPRRKATR